jgi:phosphatidylglycerophosphatase A
MKRIEKTLWKLIVTGLGLGYSPIAPGTMGALSALILATLILNFTQFPYFIILCLIIIFTFLGIIGSDKLRYLWGHDPSRIVIDEMVGMWISLMWIGPGWRPLLISFCLFRYFDIAKPFGIRKTEQLPGGLGVMADDIVAGIYANLILQLGRLIIIVFS